MSVDPRKGCILMKYPAAWQKKNGLPAKKVVPPATPQQKTYCYSPRGDVDAYVKFFSGKTNEPSTD